MMPLVVVLGALVVAALIIAGLVYESRRRRELEELAHRMGLSFSRYNSRAAPEVYSATSLCSRGHSRKSSNVITGPFGAGRVCCFDYRYTTGSGKNQTTHHASACAFHAPCHFSRMVIRPESIFDKAAALIGFDDIDLDLAEFNKRFHVSAKDKKFAYDVLTQRTMEWLLERRGVAVETGFDYVMFWYSSRLSAQKAEGLIRDSAAFYDMLPEYLVKDRSLRASPPAGTLPPPPRGDASQGPLSSPGEGFVPRTRGRSSGGRHERGGR